MCLSECVPCVQAPWGGKKKKKLSDLVELELLVVVSWWAGNWIWILIAEPSFSFGFAVAAFAGNRISLCRPQWPETYCVAQAGFKFTAIRPPCWDHRCKLPYLVNIVSLNFILKYSLPQLPWRPEDNMQELGFSPTSWVLGQSEVSSCPYLSLHMCSLRLLLWAKGKS